MINEKEFILDSSKAQFEKPTHEALVSIAEYEGKDIAVAVVDARKKSLDTGELVGKTIIWPEGYMARMDDFETQRLTTIAEALDARLIGVELPGVGISDNADAKMSLLDKLDMLRGNFDKSAHDMLGAMNEIVKFKDGEEVEFALYSQGAVLGAHMIEDLENGDFGLNLKVPKVTVFEDVNDSHFNIRLIKIGNEDTDPKTKIKQGVTNRYLDENNQYPWLTSPADRQEGGKEKVDALNKKQGGLLAVGAVALISASFPETLERAIKPYSRTGITEAEINILKADGSTVGSIEANRKTVERLQLVMPLGRVALTKVIAPEGQESHRHPFVHSMPNVDILAKEFLK